jgi:hypothetical protein
VRTGREADGVEGDLVGGLRARAEVIDVARLCLELDRRWRRARREPLYHDHLGRQVGVVPHGLAQRQLAARDPRRHFGRYVHERRDVHDEVRWRRDEVVHVVQLGQA